MYCKFCGMENDESSAQCKICRHPAEKQPEEGKKKIYLDFTLFKYSAILNQTLKHLNILSIISFPVISIIYFYHKLIRKPFWSPLYSNIFYQLQIVNLHTMKNLNLKKLTENENELRNLGFTQLIAYQDISAVSPVYHSLYINRSFGAFAESIVNKTTGSVEYVMFFAFTVSQKFITYANTDGIGCNYNQIFLKYFPGRNTKQLWDLFTMNLLKKREQMLCPELHDLMPVLYIARIRLIEIETANGHLRAESPSLKTSIVWSCHNHPLSAAVRKCPSCGLALCEACIVEYNDTYYCSKCVPWHTEKNNIKKPWGYAGIAIRTCAGIIDLGSAILVTAVFFSALHFAFNKAGLDHTNLYAFLLTQLPLSAFLYWNSIYSMAITGKTIGKRLCGLHVLDKNGKMPGYVSAFNRFAVKLCSFIFIFPIFGYLFTPFSKTKKSFVDKLSGTIVLTKKPFSKAVAASIILAPLLTVSVLLTSLIISAGSGLSSQSYLEPCWEKKGVIYKTYPDFNFRSNDPFFIYCKDSAVFCVSKKNGTTLWKRQLGNNPDLQYNKHGYVFVFDNQHTKKAALIRLDKQSGRIMWRTALPDSGFWRITGDSSMIIATSANKIMSLTPLGIVQWERNIIYDTLKAESRSGSTEYNETDYRSETDYYVQIDRVNNRVLLNSTSDLNNKRSFSYDCKTGDVSLLPGFVSTVPVIINDSCYYEHLPNSQVGVFSRSDRRMIFQTPDTAGELYIKRFGQLSDSGRISLLYETRCAYSARDGSITFCYSDDYTLETITDNVLLLSKSEKRIINQDNAIPVKKQYRIVDRFNNATLASIIDTSVTALEYVSENDSVLYILSTSGSNAAIHSFFDLLLQNLMLKPYQIKTSLLTFNKKTRRLHNTELGTNIYSAQIIENSHRDLVFMYSAGFAGAYYLK